MRRVFPQASHGLLLGLLWFSQLSAYAADVSSINHALTGLLGLLTGTLARSMAILAITSIGYLTLSGRLVIKQALYTCLGIGIIFGAGSIANLLGVGAG